MNVPSSTVNVYCSTNHKHPPCPSILQTIHQPLQQSLIRVRVFKINIKRIRRIVLPGLQVQCIGWWPVPSQLTAPQDPLHRHRLLCCWPPTPQQQTQHPPPPSMTIMTMIMLVFPQQFIQIYPPIQ